MAAVFYKLGGPHVFGIVASLAMGSMMLLWANNNPITNFHHPSTVTTGTAHVPSVALQPKTLAIQGSASRQQQDAPRVASGTFHSQGLDQATVQIQKWVVLVAAIPAALLGFLAGRQHGFKAAKDKGLVSVAGALATMSVGMGTPATALDLERGPLVNQMAPELTTMMPVRSSNLAFTVAEEQLVTFYGLDTPPTSYGGYGGNAKEKPKYSFQHPESWKFQTINKVQKGTQGIDSRFFNPVNKQENCFVITLARAGEEIGFKIRDVDSTFRGFAAADYDIADALENAEEVTQTKREVNGQPFFDYDLAGENRYLATVTVVQGKVYAFFIRSPAASFEQNEALYRTMLTSFATIPADA